MCDTVCNAVCDTVCNAVCDTVCNAVCDTVCNTVCDTVCNAVCDTYFSNKSSAFILKPIAFISFPTLNLTAYVHETRLHHTQM